MGSLNIFDVKTIIENNGIDYYVETGTGEGMCLSFAKQFPFKKLFSCEIHPTVYNNVISKFPEDNIKIYNDNSIDFLNKIKDQLDGKTLIFLDAHFPGADFNHSAYDSEKNIDLRLPLEKELDFLIEHRKNKGDVIIIDDLRIYMDGPFLDGNWADRKTSGSNRVGFIFDKLNELNKQINVMYIDQGYVVGY